ncbi:MAG: sensor domain-containing diguanylate cyclase [Desulfarculus sp.]|nr:sensor domain-containing diguanylate cyclase [Pseudomonadota bacterium]MBU4599936.1 sensor domain-containing diguanylate cyclase [Pseudomonadota bacterium]MBV1714600.1 sensor domain-containing diguanylate cyclase [Desulfarculus sp.]MBV1740137.1 sensor domain-containing diguanylate cyclase [Desulfarculus sp.]
MPRNLSTLLIILMLVVGPACDWDKSPKTKHPPTEVGLLEDSSCQMDITQATSANTASLYQVKHTNRMSLGFCRSPLWVRIPLDQTPAKGRWVLEVAAPWMDRVDLYLPGPQGGWQKQSTGLEQPLASNRQGVFALKAPADSPRSGYAYLRLQSVLSLNAGLHIWSEDAFEINNSTDTFLYGLLYGVMGAMVLINLLVLLTTRDRAYLMYVLYLLSIMAHQFCLQGQILFLPTWVWPLVPSISLVVSALALLFGAAFCRVFLNTKKNAPLADYLIRGYMAASLGLLVLGLLGQIWWGTWVVHSLALVGPMIGIYAGFMALARGFRPARFYLVAWIVLLFGTMSWGAWSMGGDFLMPLPRSLITVAAALESVLLSLALADRIGMIQRERNVLAQRERRYRQLSTTDELTGLFNSRYFRSKLASEIVHAHELGHPLGLVLLDVDDFKRYNDTYGHTEGDKVLETLGRLLRSAVRPADSPCRYGGDEFAILLPGADNEASRDVCRRISEAMARCVFLPGDGARESVTASLGATQIQPGDDAYSLLKRADRALYQAKDMGKNQTVGLSA